MATQRLTGLTGEEHLHFFLSKWEAWVDWRVQGCGVPTVNRGTSRRNATVCFNLLRGQGRTGMWHMGRTQEGRRMQQGG